LVIEAASISNPTFKPGNKKPPENSGGLAVGIG